jgi:hypothetical protein
MQYSQVPGFLSIRLFDVMRNPDQVKKQKEQAEKRESAENKDGSQGSPLTVVMKEFVETLSSLFCGSLNPT